MKKIILSLLFTTVATLTASAWQIQNGSFARWTQNLTAKPSVLEQIELFWIRNSSPAPNKSYVTQFPIRLKVELLSKIELPDTCQNRINIDFLKKVFGDSPPEAQGFENEFVRIESVDCLGALNLDRVFNIFMSRDFQSRNIQGLRSNQVVESINQVCQETAIAFLGKSSYCFTQNIWRDANRYVIHSYNETNAANIQAPVYFREVITVLERLPDQQIRLYNLAYGRGPDLKAHSLVKSVIRKQQAKLINDLIQSARP